MARDGENAHEGENDAQSRPPSRSLWTSGWVGTPGLIAALLAVVAIFHLLEHRPTAAIVYGAAALASLLGAAVVGRRLRSR